MTAMPLRPGEGKFPDDQIRIPVPPSRLETQRDGVVCHPLSVSRVESYRQTVIRIWPGGVKEPAVDLVPDPGGESQAPEDLFGVGSDARVYVVAGAKAFDRPTTREEDAATLLGLRWRLDYEAWVWCPTVATSPDRQWVEGGALLRGAELDEVTFLAARQGQSVVLEWGERGLRPVPTRYGVDVGGPDPVPVRLAPALTGCPLRGGADGVCKMYGGPWTSSSRSAALVWQRHRSMLLEAFGCDVCSGDGGTGAGGATALFTPSRGRGWQWGPPLTAVER